MSIPKTLAKGAVAGITIVVTGFVGASYASAEPLPVDPNETVGSVVGTDSVTQLTSLLQGLLQTELSEQMPTDQATLLSNALASDMAAPIEDAVADKGTLDAAELNGLEGTLSGQLEDELGVPVDLSLADGSLTGGSLTGGSLTDTASLDILGDLDVQSLLGGLLGGGGDLPVGGLQGGGDPLGGLLGGDLLGGLLGGGLPALG